MSHFGIRKIISHYINSNDRQRMISNSSQQLRRTQFLGTVPRPAVIAQVPATQKPRVPLPELKPSVMSHFVLGKNQQSVNYFANLNRNFNGMSLNAPTELKKPELLRYLGGGWKLCAVCGQEKITSGNTSNGICGPCNARIQGALDNFKGQQRLKGALEQQPDMGYHCENPCCCCEQRRQLEEQQERERKIKEKQRLQKQAEREKEKEKEREKQREIQKEKERIEREKSGQSQPFSIIVLQDCNNNNLIDQLTAALTVGCQQEKTNAMQQPQSNKNTTPNSHHNSNGCSSNSDSAQSSNGYCGSPEYCNGSRAASTELEKRPDNLTCTCNCEACRRGFENTLKLPMLIAQALEIFVMNNPLAGKDAKLGGKKSKSDHKKSGKGKKGSKHSMETTTSSTSVRSKGKGLKSSGAKASTPAVRSKGKGRKAQLPAEAASTSDHSSGKSAPSSPSVRLRENGRKPQQGAKASSSPGAIKFGRPQSKPRDMTISQSKENVRQKSNDIYAEDKGTGQNKRMRNKKKAEMQGIEPKFFLPKSTAESCPYRRAPCFENCREACSFPRNTACVPGCIGPNGYCTRFAGGCRQGNLNSCSPLAGKASQQMDRNGGGAGDQPNRAHCSRSCQGCNGCIGCPNCGHFARPPPSRDNMHPIAHFRPGVNLYPANCMLYRNGDLVRRSLVRTAAGVTLHEVQREEELEAKSPQQQPMQIPMQPSRFPCASNFQFWR
ncbi:uncharacterized protein LOC117785639 [Drosophila innubila]|uniref:uncharacterized protein LOC117785639 n=1 Tax=Drosophila innubila TaxID=198719 RepID=UPI00148C37C9|nr:uncharacterized protein LOC117785639 [Drosophila innubila]